MKGKIYSLCVFIHEILAMGGDFTLSPTVKVSFYSLALSARFTNLVKPVILHMSNEPYLGLKEWLVLFIIFYSLCVHH